jgi:hypothetical protein
MAEEDLGLTPTGEGAKIVYINDSYNLDSIPFDVDQIIDNDNNEDIV